jgi:hypothetical protein
MERKKLRRNGRKKKPKRGRKGSGNRNNDEGKETGRRRNE